MKYSKKLSIWLLSLLLSFSAIAPVYALSDPPSNADTVSGFKSLAVNVGAMITAVLADPSYNIGPSMLYNFFTAFLIIWTAFLFIFRGLELVNVISTLLLILFTKALMVNFDVLTSAVWDFGNAFAASIQVAALGGTGDVFFAPDLITQLVLSTDWTAASGSGGVLSALLTAVEQGMAAIVMFIVAGILSILAYVASVWALWGYAIAKLVGLLFLPTLLYERLSWFFDGWLRFFFGFIVYVIIARVNLVLLVIAFASYLGLSIPLTTLTPSAYSFTYTSLLDMVGFATFAIVGIMALLSTGRFAAAIVGGAVGSGAGASLSRFARILAVAALA